MCTGVVGVALSAKKSLSISENFIDGIQELNATVFGYKKADLLPGADVLLLIFQLYSRVDLQLNKRTWFA